MPTAKARYVGDGSGDVIADFSDRLKSKLRSYYPDKQATSNPVFGHPADDFVARILDEAWWAKAELHWQRLECTKQELRAEQANLLKTLTDTDKKLRTLSQDFLRLLDIDADPLGCADRLQELARHVEQTGPLLDKLGRASRSAEKQHEVAVEMAIRVLRVLKDNGIQPAATFDPATGYISDAVEILKEIGGDMGLVLAESTWRDVILEAKQKAPDLQ